MCREVERLCRGQAVSLTFHVTCLEHDFETSVCIDPYGLRAALYTAQSLCHACRSCGVPGFGLTFLGGWGKGWVPWPFHFLGKLWLYFSFRASVNSFSARLGINALQLLDWLANVWFFFFFFKENAKLFYRDGFLFMLLFHLWLWPTCWQLVPNQILVLFSLFWGACSGVPRWPPVRVCPGHRLSATPFSSVYLAGFLTWPTGLFWVNV